MNAQQQLGIESGKRAASELMLQALVRGETDYVAGMAEGFLIEAANHLNTTRGGPYARAFVAALVAALIEIDPTRAATLHLHPEQRLAS